MSLGCSVCGSLIGHLPECTWERDHPERITFKNGWYPDRASPKMLEAARAAWISAPPTITTVAGLLEAAVNAALSKITGRVQ